MATPDAEPLTTAELDALDALNRARTPGLLTVDADGRHDALVRVASTGAVVARLADDDLARALVAAANALPALLAEVRASRSKIADLEAEAFETWERENERTDA